ncbi:hypothetical protein SISNIDRAFT_484570 [Sistotremastrum niveocremeum HHB9708]|uniref:TFIIS central domain-containing protein n=1 Tax=Sistotremastrum niveocremeum HHB9708 TaxID=1314777 RepID=A0A164VPL2_9AGAM|nr:hypothetical protein SISNIDRAFT_484570 [Sistotremastrum niveocremeum HHB9708]
MSFHSASHDRVTNITLAVEWEGPEVLKEVEAPLPVAPPSPPESHTNNDSSDEEEPLGSGDEYIEEDQNKKPGLSNAKKPKPRVIQESSDDAELSDAAESLKSATRSKAKSLKRKAPDPVGSSKRKKSESGSSKPSDDPLRKYCLGKLHGILHPIFEKYHEADSEGSEQNDTSANDDEKTNRIGAAAGRFVEELEQCLFDIYSEPDKNGKKAASGKYRERFRMLSFNLEKADRVSLHRRIATLALSPLELSQMSSSDLANDQIKEKIEHAQKESLNQSILKQADTVGPRAKRTHKGEEVIETYDDITRPSKEEDERQERERMMRMRVPSTDNINTTNLPLGSPTVSAPPTGSSIPPTPSRSTFLFPVPDTSLPHESAVDLADLINIDLPDSPRDLEEPSAALDEPVVPDQPVGPPEEPDVVSIPAATSLTLQSPLRSSFNLDAIWSKPAAAIAEEPEELETSNADAEVDAETSISVDSPIKNADSGTTEEADDQDFDLFLGDTEEPMQGVEANPPLDKNQYEKERYEGLPTIWTGNINMPYDANTTYSPKITARQVGGRHMGVSPEAWNLLFPTNHPTIDGRVPIDQSSKYLIDSRLSTTKELLAVAFSPTAPEHQAAYDQIFDFLVGKNRHGLIFPWGKHPRSDAPGRELYIVPLEPSNTLPEYIDLLDELQLPQVRTEKILVGVWILHKGKLVKPATPPPPPAASQPTPPPSLQPSQLLAALGIPLLPRPSVPMVSATPPTIPTIPSALNLGALSKDVVGMSPAQLELVARALNHAQSPHQPPPPMPLSMGLNPAAMPPVLPNFPPNLPFYGHTPTLPQPLGTSGPPPPLGFSAPPMHAVPGSYSPRAPPHHSSSSPHRDDYGQDWNQRGGYRDDRPRDGPPGGRRIYEGGRERGGPSRRGGRDTDGAPRPRDSGWGNRGRGRG